MRAAIITYRFTSATKIIRFNRSTSVAYGSPFIFQWRLIAMNFLNNRTITRCLFQQTDLGIFFIILQSFVASFSFLHCNLLNYRLFSVALLYSIIIIYFYIFRELSALQKYNGISFFFFFRETSVNQNQAVPEHQNGRRYRTSKEVKIRELYSLET